MMFPSPNETKAFFSPIEIVKETLFSLMRCRISFFSPSVHTCQKVPISYEEDFHDVYIIYNIFYILYNI